MIVRMIRISIIIVWSDWYGKQQYHLKESLLDKWLLVGRPGSLSYLHSTYIIVTIS